MKLCKKCGLEKAVDRFYKDKSRKDGYMYVCKDCRKLYDSSRVYKKTRDPIFRERVNKWYKDKVKSDPAFKLLRNIRQRLRDFLKYRSARKVNKTRDLLGCEPEFLRNYIEQKFTPEMSWQNHGTYWHLDHIYPLSKVDATNESELRRVCHYTNLQPLRAEENLKKSNRILM